MRFGIWDHRKCLLVDALSLDCNVDEIGLGLCKVVVVLHMCDEVVVVVVGSLLLVVHVCDEAVVVVGILLLLCYDLCDDAHVGSS